MTRYDAVTAALRTNIGTSVRSEDLGQYPSFFVDPINTSALEHNTNQLIYGRRGSGKTLMMGALNDRIRGRFPSTKIISFFYTATTFRSSAETDKQIPTVKEKTHAFFHSFIEKLALDIFALADSVLKKPSWLESLSMAGAQQAAKRERLSRLVLELLEASGYGSITPRPGDVAFTRTEHHEQSRSSGHSLRAGASVDPLSIAPASVAISLQAKQAALTTEGDDEITEYHLARAYSPSRVRSLLLEIIDLLELDYIVIFLDEWMSLADCQVDFADRLRQTLFGDKRIAVKIAFDQYQDQLNNGGEGPHFRGLEVEADIFVAVDLDFPFRDAIQSRKLFAEALYRRLRHFEPTIDNYLGEPPLSNPERFLETVFATERAFTELCGGSHGLCRDFHLLFQSCAKRLDGGLSQSNRINLELVRRAITDGTVQTYSRAAKSVDSNTLLFRVITPHIQETGSRYFILETRPSSLEKVVSALMAKRVIHKLDSALLHPSIRGEYDCFEIAWGIFFDLMRAAEYSTGKEMDDTYDPQGASVITSANKAAFLLDLSALAEVTGDATSLLCPNCDRRFLSTEKAFEVRGICPHCFQDYPQNGQI